ncbi:hypothetical protein GCM10028801_21320 [Nocardioides maradonensis]
MSRTRLGGRNSALSAAVAAVVALAGWWWSAHHDGSTDPGGSGSSYSAKEHGTDAVSGLGYVDLSSLPPEAAQTVALIDQGGPFPYPDHDGGTFGNYEGLLPAQRSGYYKEYTVPTPGESDRGARRIIAGADGTLYWTGDHYEHFAVIRR